MDREEELKQIFDKVDEDKRNLVKPVVTEILFLEKQLQELKKYPFIKINPANSTMQKATAAGKQYKELSQTYLNAIKVLSSIINKDIQPGEDEFEEFLRENRK